MHGLFTVNSTDFTFVAIFVTFLLCKVFGLSKAVEGVQGSYHLLFERGLSTHSDTLPYMPSPKAVQDFQVSTVPDEVETPNNLSTLDCGSWLFGWQVW